jgi:radical SAM protein with 4Fe4S-binding SPASM domain
MTAPALPRELQIEVTGACNLRCRMCLVRYRPSLDRHRASLDFERFKTLVDALPELETVTLQGLGEPLMAPDLFQMLEYGAVRGLRRGFNTNATLLTRATAERLVAARLDWLHVSLDGATAATYESIRDGSNFGKVRRNVRGLVEVMRARGAERPRLSPVFVTMRRNLGELPALVRLSAEWGIPTLRVQNLSHSFSDTDPAGDYHEIRAFAEGEALWQAPSPADAAVFDEARALAATLGVALRLPELDAEAVTPRSGPGCDWPWRSAYVRQDGQVQPCCMVMGGDRAIVGDLATESFPVVWRGARYEAFRAGLVTGRPADVCRGCSMYRGVF